MANILERPLHRRSFLKLTALGAAGLVLDLHTLAPRAAEAGPLATDVTYRGWEDVYRERWIWDKVAVSTHADANCIGNCAWRLYVRDNIVWREEQTAPYPASNPSIPDFNPRGCQKGATCSQLIRGPTRLRYPLKRVGKRGAGRWKRISWGEALDEVARHVVDALARRGGQGVMFEGGSNGGFGSGLAGTQRFFRQIGAPVIDGSGVLGDLVTGPPICFGTRLPGGSSDDWFRCDYLVVWEFNPIYTRIPDAHYLTEARYRGARVVTIAPDYSPSAIHTDLWLPLRPGTDAALALAACRVIIDENLYQADYIREQTDLPFLVRNDTHRFLREADVVPGGHEDRFACWDEARQAIVWAPGTMGSTERTLRFPAGIRVALEASAQVRLSAGQDVGVRTVFSRLRQSLQPLDAESAAKITGIQANVIRRFAREFATARSAYILSGAGQTKHFHGDLAQRTQILLASLTGNIGRPGAGWRTDGFGEMLGLILVIALDDLERFESNPPPKSLAEAFPSAAASQGFGTEFTSVSGTVFYALHGGTGALQLNPAYNDPALPRPPESYLKDALAQGEVKVGIPADAQPPEVWFSAYGNVLRCSRMGDRIRDTLFAQTKLNVNVGIRMCETTRYADIILPASANYEKFGIKYTILIAPFLTLGDQAVPPLGECKPEWEIFSLLAERVGAEAKRRGLSTIKGWAGQTCEIGDLGKRFSSNGYLGPQDDEKVTRLILHTSRLSRGMTLEELRARGGAIRWPELGPDEPVVGLYSRYREKEPLTGLRDFVEKKEPWPTLTGRQQFYIDHPWFLETGEALPVHKEPPKPGGDHPFTLTGGHTRWSIHSIWRDQNLMLQLQRGEPVVYLNTEDARQRGIADHDYVRVSNDVGAFVARAKPTGAMRPKQVHIYHAWEPYHFRGGSSDQHICPSPLKITQLVSGYGQLHWGPSYYDPDQNDRDTRVDITKV